MPLSADRRADSVDNQSLRHDHSLGIVRRLAVGAHVGHRVQPPRAGNALELVLTPIEEPHAGPGDEILHGLRDEHLAAFRSGQSLRYEQATPEDIAAAKGSIPDTLVERFRAQTSVMSQSEIHPRARLKTVGSI